MGDALQVAVERGPKGRRVAVHAVDWPGLQRGGRDEASALEQLAAYPARYAPVAAAAGLADAFDVSAPLEVVERYEGAGMTDHYGISFASTPRELEGITTAQLERRLALLQGCWAVFDRTRGRVSAQLRRGPRGGGRDRDQVVRHVVHNELAWGWKVGGPRPPHDPAAWTFDEQELALHRERFVRGVRRFHAEGRPARTWSPAFLVRHTAYHAMDHAWEMQDRDLTDG